MASVTQEPAVARRAQILGVVFLIAGVVLGVVSVYSNSRAACAVWVAAALTLAFASGLTLRPAQRRRP